MQVPGRAMSALLSPALEQSLAGATSISALRKVLAGQGLSMTDLEIAKGLIRDSGGHRFQGLSEASIDQLARIIVLAEQDAAIAQLLLQPERVAEQLPVLLAPHGMVADSELVAALCEPLELDDAQLDQVVGGVALTGACIAGIIAAVGTAASITIVPIAITWINRHYDLQQAKLEAGQTI